MPNQKISTKKLKAIVFTDIVDFRSCLEIIVRLKLQMIKSVAIIAVALVKKSPAERENIKLS